MNSPGRIAAACWVRVRSSLRRAVKATGPHFRAAAGLLKEAGRGWQKHMTGRTAAAIAYYGIFSLAPILVIMVSVAQLLVRPASG